MTRQIAFLALVAVLTACSEKPQSHGAPKIDQAPAAGTGVASFTAPDWKAGDKVSWEQALKARAQYGQNEYSRAAAAPGAKPMAN